jgi:hypothetical protein
VQAAYGVDGGLDQDLMLQPLDFGLVGVDDLPIVIRYSIAKNIILC